MEQTGADVPMDRLREQRSGSDRRRSRRLEQNRLRSIVERMADGVVIVGLDGVIRFANPAAEALFGRSASELAGTSLGFPAVVGETAEIEVVRPGGTSAVAAELRVVDTDWEGEPARLLSLRDITDRKRAEERAGQLERERIARAEAEAASQAKSDFLAVMSHELRTPLNAVIGYAELLDLGIAGPVTIEQRHQISRIRASGRHLLGLVNEVLDLAKVETGRLSLHATVARVSYTTDAAIALVQPVAEARGIRMVARYLAEDATYEGDEDRVRQVLVNLLNNAVKFTDPGGSVNVECGATSHPDPEARLMGAPWIYVRVSDTGIGIPSEQLAAIFDPFVQVERGHTRQNDGSGLGLTISRRLARMMRGDLTVRSQQGKGSTFTLWLPAASGAAHEAARRRAESPDTAARLQGLADIGEALLRELEAVLNGFVARVRTEPLMPAAQSLRFSQLADHIGTYVANIGGVLVAVEEARGQPSALVADGAEIQRLVAERHGAQRARIGWTVAALEREWRILSEEMERAIRRRAHAINELALNEALSIIARFVEEGVELSSRALARTLLESGEFARG